MGEELNIGPMVSYRTLAGNLARPQEPKARELLGISAGQESSPALISDPLYGSAQISLHKPAFLVSLCTQ